jgi:ankyrin repeat protein
MENRTYLWLHLTFDIIRRKQAAFAKMSNIQSLLDSLPSKISDAYDEILRKSEDESVAESLLQIMLAATRPLTLDEANIALTLATEESRPLSHDELDSKLWAKEGFKSTVKNLCGLFITVHNSKLFFIHQTAREFLVTPHISDGKGKETWKGRLSVPRAHGVVSRTCLYYLSLDGFSADFDNHITVVTHDKLDKRYSFLKYSAINWTLHYKSRQDQVERHSPQLAKALLDTPGRQRDIWLSFHSLSTNDSLNIAQNWVGLILASFLGLTDVVDDILIQNRPDINAGGARFYGNALQVASARGHRETVKLLLSKNADVNAQGGAYGNALQAASRAGHREIVELLLSENADVSAQGGFFGNALQAASYTGHREIVKLLLSNANVNAQGGYLGNALQAASYTGHREIVELLLSMNADVNAQGGYYGNALRAASTRGHREIVELLRSRGAIEEIISPALSILSARTPQIGVFRLGCRSGAFNLPEVSFLKVSTAKQHTCT